MTRLVLVGLENRRIVALGLYSTFRIHRQRRLFQLRIPGRSARCRIVTSPDPLYRRSLGPLWLRCRGCPRYQTLSRVFLLQRRPIPEQSERAASQCPKISQCRNLFAHVLETEADLPRCSVQSLHPLGRHADRPAQSCRVIRTSSHRDHLRRNARWGGRRAVGIGTAD
jgi:hypothetical protein